MPVTLYHNPKCSKSREVLAIIQSHGITPHIIDYLNTPLDKVALSALFKQSGLTAWQAIRTDVAIYPQIEAQNLSEEQLIEMIVQHPELLNRPFVQTAKGAKLCRPVELVHQLL